MARHITVNKLDDFDGTPAKHTFEFTVDGTTYTTDLNHAHAAELRALLKPYLTHAFDQRKATTNPAAVPTKPRKARRKPGKPPPQNLPDQGLIRAWARANGHPVKPTGAIKQALRDAYNTAHKQSA